MKDLMFDFTEWRVSCGFSPLVLTVSFDNGRLDKMTWKE